MSRLTTRQNSCAVIVPGTTLPPVAAVPEAPAIPLPPPVLGGAVKLTIAEMVAAALSSAY
jgi:hypothetical protein